MRIVVSLGDSALVPHGRSATIGELRATLRASGAVLGRVAREHQLVVTVGAEPQLRELNAQVATYDPDPDVTLDVVETEAAAVMGYLLEHELEQRLPPRRAVVTVLTRTLVAREDPRAQAPTAFVGPCFDQLQSHWLEQRRGWVMRPYGDGFRRVVPCVVPLAVEPVAPIGVLLDLGHTVVCGGGVPMRIGPHGLEGVEAVVDQDVVSALLAQRLAADLLVVATDVGRPGESRGRIGDQDHSRWRSVGHDQEEAGVLGTLDPELARPKVRALARFARTGGRALVGSLADLEEMARHDHDEDPRDRPETRWPHRRGAERCTHESETGS